mmetsp:Transcript_2384/g.3645  ORF Transcript_2384/g.3645 Transcript_2384/m.3645 type:complete len:221 (-) Transcript_2384:3466-4128(-)
MAGREHRRSDRREFGEGAHVLRCPSACDGGRPAEARDRRSQKPGSSTNEAVEGEDRAAGQGNGRQLPYVPEAHGDKDDDGEPNRCPGDKVRQKTEDQGEREQGEHHPAGKHAHDQGDPEEAGLQQRVQEGQPVQPRWPCPQAARQGAAENQYCHGRRDQEVDVVALSQFLEEAHQDLQQGPDQGLHIRQSIDPEQEGLDGAEVHPVWARSGAEVEVFPRI